MTTIRTSKPAILILMAGLTQIVVAGDLHLGVARLVLVLAFMAVVPGWATVSLLFPGLSGLSSVVLLSVGTSVAIDVVVAQISLSTHAWNPVWMISVLAALSMALASLSLAMDYRAQRREAEVTSGGPPMHPYRRSAESRPNVAIRQEVFITLCVLGIALLADAAEGGSVPRLLAGAVGAAVAAVAGAGCLVVVVRGQLRRGRQADAFWAAAALAAVVVLVVTVRFLVLG